MALLPLNIDLTNARVVSPDTEKKPRKLIPLTVDLTNARVVSPDEEPLEEKAKTPEVDIPETSLSDGFGSFGDAMKENARVGDDRINRIKRSVIGGVMGIPQGAVDMARGAVRGVADDVVGAASNIKETGRFLLRNAAPTILGQDVSNRTLNDITPGVTDTEDRKIAVDSMMRHVPDAPDAFQKLADEGVKIRRDTSELSPEGQSAYKGFEPSGNLFKGEFDLGKNPTIEGAALHVADVLGSFVPVIGASLLGGPLAGGIVGGTMAGSEGSEAAKEFIAKQSHDSLYQNTPLYRRLVDHGVNPDQARAQVIDRVSESAALFQGMVGSVGDVTSAKLVMGSFDHLIGKIPSRLARAPVVAAAEGGQESSVEVGEGVATDLAIQREAKNKEIGENSTGNAVMGLMGGVGIGGVKGATTLTPEEQIGRELQQNVDGASFDQDAIDQDVRKSMNPPQPFGDQVRAPGPIERASQKLPIAPAPDTGESVETTLGSVDRMDPTTAADQLRRLIEQDEASVVPAFDPAQVTTTEGVAQAGLTEQFSAPSETALTAPRESVKQPTEKDIAWESYEQERKRQEQYDAQLKDKEDELWESTSVDREISGALLRDIQRKKRDQETLVRGRDAIKRLRQSAEESDARKKQEWKEFNEKEDERDVIDSLKKRPDAIEGALQQELKRSGADYIIPDVKKKDGKPFAKESTAALAAKNQKLEGYVVTPVDGGFVLRKPPPQETTDGQETRIPDGTQSTDGQPVRQEEQVQGEGEEGLLTRNPISDDPSILARYPNDEDGTEARVVERADGRFETALWDNDSEQPVGVRIFQTREAADTEARRLTGAQSQQEPDAQAPTSPTGIPGTAPGSPTAPTADAGAEPETADASGQGSPDVGAVGAGEDAGVETDDRTAAPDSRLWAMTFDGFKERYKEDIARTASYGADMLGIHKNEVRKAISEGKPVPPEVLADYPDLAPTGQPDAKIQPPAPGQKPAAQPPQPVADATVPETGSAPVAPNAGQGQGVVVEAGSGGVAPSAEQPSRWIPKDQPDGPEVGQVVTYYRNGRGGEYELPVVARNGNMVTLDHKGELAALFGDQPTFRILIGKLRNLQPMDARGAPTQTITPTTAPTHATRYTNDAGNEFIVTTNKNGQPRKQFVKEGKTGAMLPLSKRDREIVDGAKDATTSPTAQPDSEPAAQAAQTAAAPRPISGPGSSPLSQLKPGDGARWGNFELREATRGAEKGFVIFDSRTETMIDGWYDNPHTASIIASRMAENEAGDGKPAPSSEPAAKGGVAPTLTPTQHQSIASDLTAEAKGKRVSNVAIRAKVVAAMPGAAKEEIGAQVRAIAGDVQAQAPTAPKPAPKPRKAPSLTIDPAKDDLLAAIAKLGGLASVEAEQQGIDRAHFRKRGHLIHRVFTKGGLSFDGMAEALSQYGYPVTDAKGNYTANALLDSLSTALSGRRQMSDQGADAEGERLAERHAEMIAAQDDDWTALDQMDLDDPLSFDDQREAEIRLVGVHQIGEQEFDALRERIAEEYDSADMPTYFDALEEAIFERKAEIARASQEATGSRQAEPSGFTLEGESEADLAAKRAEAKRVADAEAKRVKAEDEKRAADGRLDDFDLSPLEGDKAKQEVADRGQGGMDFGGMQQPSVEENIHRGRNAIHRVAETKEDFSHAMFRDDMGWIDFRWGSEGGAPNKKGKRSGASGVAHILEARARKDGLSHEQANDFLSDVVNAIARGTATLSKYNNTNNEVSGTKAVVNDGATEVVLLRDDGSDAWMLTGYEKSSVDSGQGGGKTGATHVEPTPPRLDMGAEGKKSLGQTATESKPAPISSMLNPLSAYNQAAREYGFAMDEDGTLFDSENGKRSNLVVRIKKGRMRIEGKDDGRLVQSGAAKPEALVAFLKSFWGAEKLATPEAKPATDAKDIRFDMAATSTGPRLSPPFLQARIDAITKAWRGLGVPVRVVASEKLLPANVRAQLTEARKSSPGARVRGVFANGEIILVASNLGSVREAVQVLAHEAVGHYGVRAVFGPKLNALLDQLIAERGLTDREAAEEMLAEMAERNDPADLPFLRRVYQSLRAALRQMGIGLKLSDGDLREILAASKRYVERGDSKRGRFGGKAEGRNQDARFMFAGRKAKGANLMDLTTALRRAKAGEDRETIRKETGWRQAKDGKWRFEISDYDASLNGEGFQFKDFFDRKDGRYVSKPLGEILNHPALFSAYPELAIIPVYPQVKKGAVIYQGNGNEKIAAYEYGNRESSLNSLLHEVMHGIQYIEGFATGGFNQRLAGEVEARNVEHRSSYSDRLREMRSPESTQEVADADVIVTFNGKEAASAPSPANAGSTMNARERQQRYRELIDRALDDNQWQQRVMIAEGVDADPSGKLSEVFGFPVAKQYLTPDDIRKTNKRHGAGNEQGFDQVGLEREDYVKLLELLRDPETFRKTTSRNGKASAEFGMAFSDGTYVVAEVETAEPGAVSIKTGWRKLPGRIHKGSTPFPNRKTSENAAGIDSSISSDSLLVNQGADETDIRFSLRNRHPKTAFHEENIRIRDHNPALWDKAALELKRQLGTGGLLPGKTFDFKIDRDNHIGATEMMVRNLATQYQRAVKTAYGKPTPAQQRMLHEALGGKVDPSIHQPVLVPILKMRQYIDGFSNAYASVLFKEGQELLARGNLEGARAKVDMLNTIASHVGEYVHRSYQAFDDPKWFDHVPDQVMDDARAYFMKPRTMKSGKVKPGKTREEANKIIDTILHEGKASDSMTSFIKESKLGAKDLSILKRRKKMAPEVLALLGEHIDPSLNFARSITKMSRLIFNQQFLDRVLADGLDVYLFKDRDSAPLGANKKIATSESYAPLADLYTFPEIERAFRDALDQEVMSEAWRQLLKYNGIVKYGKVVLNPTSVFRNWMSNIFIATANGDWSLTKTGSSFAAFREYMGGVDNGKMHALLVKLKRIGVTHDNPNAGEMIRFLEEAMMADQIGGGVQSAIQAPFATATKLYQYMDDFWKISAYLNAVQRFKKAKPNWTAAQIDKEVAERIRNTYPTYSMTGRLANTLRRNPFIGDFVSFSAEIIRTQANILKYIAHDLKDPDLRGEAYRRIAGLAINSSLIYGMSAMSMLAWGVDDDEEEAMRNSGAPWSANSNLFIAGRDAQGRPWGFDLSFIDPYAYFKKPINALLRGRPLDEALLSGGWEVLRPFLDWGMVATTVKEVVITNKTEFGGDIRIKGDAKEEQVKAVLKHIWDSLAPGLAMSATRFNRAWNGEISTSGSPYK